MTKPGNSDPDEQKPAESVEPEPAEPTESAPPAAKADPDEEPLMAQLEKAPPAPEEPVMPTAREAQAKRAAYRRPEDPQPPQLLRYAFYLYVLAGVIGLIGGIYMLINKQEIIDTIVRNNTDDRITNEQIASGTNTLLWLLMVVTLVFGVLFALFGYKVAEGVRRARMLLTILTVIIVLFYYVLFATPFGLLSALIALVATVLLYLPASSRYFRREPRV